MSHAKDAKAAKKERKENVGPNRLNLRRQRASLDSADMASSPTIIAIGDGSLLLELPREFSYEFEADGTICAFYNDAPEIVALRFSSLTVEAATPEKTSGLDLAAQMLARGKMENRETGRAGNIGWYHEDKDSVQDRTPIWLRFWHVGCRNIQLVVSLCCDAAQRQHPRTCEAIKTVPTLLTNLKRRPEKSPLTSHETEGLEQQRLFVRNLLGTRYGTYMLPKLKCDLPTLQNVINDRALSPEQEYEWSCMGVAFGDVVANELGLDWIAQCDQYGVELALNLKGSSITLFPRTMILKRIEKGEAPDLEFLFAKLAEGVEGLKQKGC